MLEIDGSHGEGGGQILRTALSLSCLSGTAFRIVNIRRGRSKPGLMPQHLAAVRAAQAVCDAAVAGAERGSTALVFTPGRIRGGNFTFDIGTAGASTLVLQTLIPPLLHAPQPSTITISGGTHVPASPSYHYLAEVFAPLLKRLGASIRLTIEAYGFYPRGGGRVRAEIMPVPELLPLRVSTPAELERIKGHSGVGNLPLAIARRQRDAALATIEAMLPDAPLPAAIELLEAPGPGQGTFLFLRAEATELRAGFTALGALGKRAETVGAEAAAELCRHLATGAALDPHLADQLVPYLALCREESSFTTSAITRHLLTNLWVAALFRPLRATVAGEEGGPGKVTITPG